MMNKILTIPRHTDFLRQLARGLLTEDKILGAAAPSAADMPATTILFPTRRAGRLFSQILLEESPHKALMLPNILPLDDLEDNLDDDLWMQTRPDISPAIDAVARHLALTALIRSSPVMENIGAQSAAAADLAYELARFIDLTDRHEADRSQISTLVPEQFAEHWQITLALLNVIIKVWPDYLAKLGLTDPIHRRNLLLRSFAEHLSNNPPQAPVIIAGSTGSLPATEFLLKAVAKFERGAIILPGLDRNIAEEDWQAVADDPTHPQYGLKNLLDKMAVHRTQVKLWPESRTPDARDWLIGETLRPTETTHRWPQNISNPPEGLDETLKEITLIKTDNLREEAAVIALMLRESLEQKNQTAALITYDRTLARRVVGMLKIWDIYIDDSAGVRLTSLPVFVFLKLIAEMVMADFAPIPFLSCVKHPLAHGGQEKTFRQKIRKIEQCALRGPAPKGLASIRQKLKDPELIALMAVLEKTFAPLKALAQNPEANFIDLLKAHILCAEALAAKDAQRTHDLWTHEAGKPIADHLRKILADGDALKNIAVKAYPFLFESLFASAPVFRPPPALGSRLHIWSPLEARMQSPDLAILGALNENVWPQPIAADPWLNRAMRAALGLAPPEAQTGQAAHDFAQNLAAPKLVLTCANKGADGAPQQPSRWLLRLQNVLKGSGRELKTENVLDRLERSVNIPIAQKPQPKPQPQPGLKAKPKKLSASSLTKLILDPYAFYAERILRLKPLKPIDEEPTPAERGSIIHDILEEFAMKYPRELPDDARAQLSALGKKHFDAAQAEQQIVRAFWMPFFENMAEQFILLEKNTLRKSVSKILTEIEGKIDLEISGQKIILTARADRIDIIGNDRCAIYDYKTGRLPPMKHIHSPEPQQFEPQLPLEAIIAQQGGFEKTHAMQVERLAFVKLKEASWENMLKEILHPETLAQESLEFIRTILEKYLDENEPLAPPEKIKSEDYEHLARRKAWSVAEEEENQNND